MQMAMCLAASKICRSAAKTAEACAHRDLEAVVGVGGDRQRLLRQAARLQELCHIVQLVLWLTTTSQCQPR